MNKVDRVFLGLAYLFAFAAFTTTSLMTVAFLLILPLTLLFAALAIKNGEAWLASQKSLLAFGVCAYLSLLLLKPQFLSVESSALGRVLLMALLPFAVRRILVSAGVSKHVSRLLMVLIVTSSLAHISGLIAYFSGYNPLRFGPTPDVTRSTGIFSMAMTYGYGTQFLFLLLMGLLVAYKDLRGLVARHWLVIGVTLSALGLLASLARGAIIGALLALPFLFMQTAPRVFRFSLAFCAGGAVLLAAIMLTVPASNRLSYKSDSNLIRLSQYETAYHGIQESPWLGHGFRQFDAEVGRIKIEHDIAFKNFVGNSHNNLVEAWASTGLFGFVAFLLFLFFWLREILKMQHFLKPTFLAIWVAFVISGLFQTTFTDAENLYFIMALYATSAALSTRENAKAPGFST